jgi:hypothetical protein
MTFSDSDGPSAAPMSPNVMTLSSPPKTLL